MQSPVLPPPTMNAPMLKLPPGPSYIVDQIFSWKTASYLSSVVLTCFGTNAVGIYAPVWAIVASSVIALPAIFYLQGELRYWKDKRTAAALGARLAPKVPRKKPFGIDLIATLLEAQKNGYVGKF